MPPLPVTPEFPRITLGQQPMDQIMREEPEKGKRRRDSDPGLSFVMGPGPEPTAKRREADHKKEKGVLCWAPVRYLLNRPKREVGGGLKRNPQYESYYQTPVMRIRCKK